MKILVSVAAALGLAAALSAAPQTTSPSTNPSPVVQTNQGSVERGAKKPGADKKHTGHPGQTAHKRKNRQHPGGASGK